MKKQKPIKLDSYEQLWQLTSKTVVEFTCSICGQTYTARVDNRRQKDKNSYLVCKQCLTKRTCMEKYGVSNVGQLEKTREICRNRDKTWYDKRNEKTIETNMRKYGTAHPQKLKEFKEKQKHTMLQKYGIDNIFRDKEYIKECCQKKFGRDNYFSGEEGKRIAEEACFKKHGVKRALEKEEFKEKYRKTSMERYGVQNYGMTQEHTDKMIGTNIEKFGTTHAPSNKYIFEEVSFDSSWELCFWIYCRDNNIPIEREPINLPYSYNGKIHYYSPDFKINGKELIEIKGWHFLNEHGDLIDVFDGQNKGLIQAKNECIKDNNVKVITSPEVHKYTKYVKNTYGKKYLEQFKRR